MSPWWAVLAFGVGVGVGVVGCRWRRRDAWELWRELPGYVSLFAVDLDRHLFLHPRSAALHGVTIEELAAKPVSFFYEAAHPDDRWKLKEVTEVRVGEEHASEIRYRNADGEYRWIRGITRAVELPGVGRVLLSHALDVSEEVEAREERDLAAACLEHCPDAMLLLDREGRIREANPATCQRLGYTREELLERTIFDLNPRATPETWAIVWQTRTEGSTGRFDTEHHTKSGDPIPVEVMCAQVRFHQDPLLCGFARDLRPRLREEEQRQQLMRELSHRVKNNLATVLALADQNLSASGGDVEVFRETFRGRLMTLARAHEALGAADWGDLDLASLVERAVLAQAPDPARFQVQHGGLRLRARACNPLALVLHELTTNAIKHGALSPSNGRVELHASVQADHFLLEWIERGGPAPRADAAPNLGRELIEGLVGHELDGQVDFALHEAGLRCQLRAPAARVLEPPQPADLLPSSEPKELLVLRHKR